MKKLFLMLVPWYYVYAKYTGICMIVGLSVVVFGSASIIRFVEPYKFESYFDAVYWTITTMATVGYGDYSPESRYGRTFAMFLMVFGIAIHGIVIGQFVEFFSSFSILKRKGRLRCMEKNHTIVINYSKKSKRFIEHLLEKDHQAKIVLIDTLEENPFNHERIFYIYGSASQLDVLEKANIEKSKVVVIFSNPAVMDNELNDGRTLLIATLIESSFQSVYTLVEVMEQKNEAAFQYAGVDEYIFTEDLSAKLAVIEALEPGKLKLIRQMTES